MDILTLLQHEGWKLTKKAMTKGGEYAGACPWCGGDDRFLVWPEKSSEKGGEFWCRQCEKGGDGIEFLKLYKGLSYRAACRELGVAVCSYAPGPQRRLRGELHAAPLPPNRPPANEVADLWEACLSVDAAVDTATWNHDPLQWIQARKLDSEAIAAGNLARMIPDGIPLPPWAVFGRPWPIAGYRLVVRAWNARGGCESLHARYTQPGQSETKAVWPKGFDGRGLVMANNPAVELLQGQGGPGQVVIVEGIPDWLTCAVAWPLLPVFGITAGSWPNGAAHAARIPDGSKVIIRTDGDPTGVKYAGNIQESFAGRPGIELRRKVRA